MANFKITKKEAIENLKTRAKELADIGDLAGVTACMVQIDVIRATNTRADKGCGVTITRVFSGRL